MTLVEKLGLQDPLLLLAAPAEAIDPITQRAIRFAVEHLHNSRREAPVRFRPGNSLIEVHEMTLIDACWRRVDDDEHLGCEIVAAPIEDHAGHVNGFGFVRMRALVELERRQTMLAIDNQEFFLGFLKATHSAVLLKRCEAEFLRGE